MYWVEQGENQRGKAAEVINVVNDERVRRYKKIAAAGPLMGLCRKLSEGRLRVVCSGHSGGVAGKRKDPSVWEQEEQSTDPLLWYNLKSTGVHRLYGSGHKPRSRTAWD